MRLFKVDLNIGGRTPESLEHNPFWMSVKDAQIKLFQLYQAYRFYIVWESGGQLHFSNMYRRYCKLVTVQKKPWSLCWFLKNKSIHQGWHPAQCSVLSGCQLPRLSKGGNLQGRPRGNLVLVSNQWIQKGTWHSDLINLSCQKKLPLLESKIVLEAHRFKRHPW